MFYLWTPSETSSETVAELPDYYGEVLPMLVVVVLLEMLILLALRKYEFLYRTNDYITSGGALLMQFLLGVHLYDVNAHAYVWVFDELRLFTLPWNSPVVWYAALLGVDFLYYAFHRTAHEVAIMWAFHQAHHSSEDYNIATASRQHVFQAHTSTVFYFPLAIVGFPPSIVFTHQVLNLLFQIWIHTELIDRCGPLEWILNTPSHHRVHHGRNPYCVDKNYAGVLIIWDRLFGTFEAERKDDEVVYGLVTNVNSFNPLYVQFFAIFDIFFKKFPKVKTWKDRLKILFFPPGWEPGHNRWMTCHNHSVPEIQRPVIKYGPMIPLWQKAYVNFHFIVVFFLYVFFGLAIRSTAATVSTAGLLKYSLFAILSLQCFGMLFDSKSYAPTAELSRCLLVACLVLWYYPRQIGLFLVFAASALIWLQPVQRRLAEATEGTKLQYFMTLRC